MWILHYAKANLLISFSLSLDYFFSLPELFLKFRLNFAILHLYILYIYIANPWKKNVYIVCGPFTTECLGVVYFSRNSFPPLLCVSVSVSALSFADPCEAGQRGIQIPKCWYRNPFRVSRKSPFQKQTNKHKKKVPEFSGQSIAKTKFDRS